VRHVREELRFQGGGLLELECLPAQKLVLLRDVGRRRMYLLLELV